MTIDEHIERAIWLDWQEKQAEFSAERIYFGHETCENLLPPPEDACAFAESFREQGLSITLVTPFLTNAGLDSAIQLIDRLASTIGELEVVCSDWGLLHYLSGKRNCKAVLGRVLVGQSTDPRIIRILAPRTQASRRLRHLDGTECLLKYKEPSPALSSHYRGCSIDKLSVIDFLNSLGVQRCELNNVGQGLDLSKAPVGWFYSLHVPEVLVTIVRKCPGAGEDFNVAASCRPPQCGRQKVEWRLSSPSIELFRRSNALYYSQSILPENISSLGINRIVCRQYSAG